MSETHIPKVLRESVTAQARQRCGYCLTSERIVGTPMEIDHIIPESLGGPTEEENLWLACSPCNDHKATASLRSTHSQTRSCVSLTHGFRRGVSISPGCRKATALPA